MSEKKKIKFIDLFAGIWWFHLALNNLWLECVSACEIDKFARQTYEDNHKKHSSELFDNWLFFEDVRKIDTNLIPQFDILCAWFPCQSFSQAGKKLWFSDDRWNVFFEIIRILKDTRPKAFFLENVRNLEKHDEWKTFKIIKKSLEDLWYSFNYKLLKASDFWLPQHRARLYIVWFDKNQLIKNEDFIFPKPTWKELVMSDVFDWKCEKEIWYTLRVWGRSSGINDRRNWDGYLVNWEVKRIWIKEWKIMMWLPDDFTFNVSHTQAMKQLWNSVAINTIDRIWLEISNYLKNNT